MYEISLKHVEKYVKKKHILVKIFHLINYLIYKIFILPIDDTESRRIFHFIHLPSKETLKKRDAEWDIIWNEYKKLGKFVR